MMKVTDIIIFIIAYLLGSIPFSVIIGKVFFNTDVRKHGSGNPGATNTLRTLGVKAGIFVLILDVLKGFIAVLLAKYFGTWQGVTDSHLDRMTVAGALAILGHLFSPFLGFKGGKGVATSMGVIFCLMPWWASLTVVLVFTTILWISRYVSLSSILSAFAFTLLTLLFRNGMYIPVIFSICITLLIVIKHKDNIIRLMKGEENRFVINKKTV